MLQCDAVRASGYKVVLLREGADEVLVGYFFARQDYLRSTNSDPERSMMEHGATNTPLIFQSAIAGQEVGSIATLEHKMGFTPSWRYEALTYPRRDDPQTYKKGIL
jgi:asparagine synthetase B (glutamine-hydrolysing)